MGRERETLKTTVLHRLDEFLAGALELGLRIVKGIVKLAQKLVLSI